jgi:hypothetical protein
MSSSVRMPPPTWHGRPVSAAMRRTQSPLTGRPLARPVEIDEVQEGRALVAPGLGGGDRVVVEDGFAGVVALGEADRLAGSEVDRRVDLHWADSWTPGLPAHDSGSGRRVKRAGGRLRGFPPAACI